MSAILFLITATLTVASVSWEAYNIIVMHQFEPGMPQINSKCEITQKFAKFLPANQVHYTIGNDIYVGWVAGFIALITCVALLFGGCNSDDDEDEYEDQYTMVST